MKLKFTCLVSRLPVTFINNASTNCLLNLLLSTMSRLYNSHSYTLDVFSNNYFQFIKQLRACFL